MGESLERVLVSFMWVTGVGTALVAVGLLLPSQLQQSMFALQSVDPLAQFLTRGWAGLVGIMGLLLIIGARSPELRTFCLNVSAGSKAMFIALMLIYGQQFIPSAGIALFIDALVVLAALLNQVGAMRRV